jgi:hypothetical protein
MRFREKKDALRQRGRQQQQHAREEKAVYGIPARTEKAVYVDLSLIR